MNEITIHSTSGTEPSLAFEAEEVDIELFGDIIYENGEIAHRIIRLMMIIPRDDGYIRPKNERLH